MSGIEVFNQAAEALNLAGEALLDLFLPPVAYGPWLWETCKCFEYGCETCGMGYVNCPTCGVVMELGGCGIYCLNGCESPWQREINGMHTECQAPDGTVQWVTGLLCYPNVEEVYA